MFLMAFIALGSQYVGDKNEMNGEAVSDGFHRLRFSMPGNVQGTGIC